MSPSKFDNATTCYHCGEECDGSIVAHEKNFCCNGCQTVYELLEENNLCSYYDFNQKPGISLRQQINDKKYAYLDDAQVIHQLIEFASGDVSTVRFYIPKIHCSSCIYLLENLYRIREGISRSQVDFLKREVKITFVSSTHKSCDK
jgi:Cu+-exporting ATPase